MSSKVLVFLLISACLLQDSAVFCKLPMSLLDTLHVTTRLAVVDLGLFLCDYDHEAIFELFAILQLQKTIRRSAQSMYQFAAVSM